jgi:hypothetical protein
VGGGSGSSGAHAEATVQRGQRPGHGTSFLQRILNTHSWLQRKGGRRDGKGTVSQWQGTARTAAKWPADYRRCGCADKHACMIETSVIPAKAPMAVCSRGVTCSRRGGFQPPHVSCKL